METKSIKDILNTPRQMSESFYLSKVTTYPEVGGFLAIILGILIIVLGVLAKFSLGIIFFGLIVGGAGFALYKYMKTHPDPKKLEEVKNTYNNAPISYAAVIQQGSSLAVVVYSPDPALGHNLDELKELASKLAGYRKSASTEDEKYVAKMLNNTGTNFFDKKLPESLTNGKTAYFTVTSSLKEGETLAGFVITNTGETKVNHYAIVGKLVSFALKIKASPTLTSTPEKGSIEFEPIHPKHL
ncbi:hypothetical protein Dip518_000567 [Parelusimicrobium proximum]|uniref:hypothetical protein n=1 Tax=Parelusimicrobium proximum TaxID=3228953 RepID=UPI003D17BD7E